ncbi:hypothetical protein FQZ97_706100 [compost metagenome]
MSATHTTTEVLMATAPMITGITRPTTQYSRARPNPITNGVNTIVSRSIDRISAASRATVPATATRCLSSF